MGRQFARRQGEQGQAWLHAAGVFPGFSSGIGSATFALLLPCCWLPCAGQACASSANAHALGPASRPRLPLHIASHALNAVGTLPCEPFFLLQWWWRPTSRMPSASTCTSAA